MKDLPVNQAFVTGACTSGRKGVFLENLPGASEISDIIVNTPQAK
jgi:hypothetical protein